MKKLRPTSLTADLSMADYRQATGFKHRPPTPEEVAAARTAHEAQMSEIAAQVAASPELQTVAAEVRAELDVAMQLHKLRKRSKKTQAEIAAAFGTTQSAVAHIERGRNLRLNTIYKYAAACGFPSIRIAIQTPRPCP